MFKVVAAILGATQATKIPLVKKELTRDQYKRQLMGIEEKFLGTVGTEVPITDHSNAQYFVETEVGTPGQKFTMVPDTGSSNVWVYAHNCWSVVCWTHKTFDNSDSSTYTKDGKAFKISYGSGGISGTQANDIVSLGGITSKMGFGEITEAKGVSFLASPMSGIIGLAYSAISINKLDTWLDLATISDKSFTFYLHTNPTKSYMTFPAGQIQGYGAQQVHKVVEQKYWALDLKGFTSGGKTTPITGYKAVIDSGTSLLVGPKEIIDELIKGITVNGDCSNLDEMTDISF